MYVYKSINYRLHKRDHKNIYLQCNCDTECVEKYCMCKQVFLYVM